MLKSTGIHVLVIWPDEYLALLLQREKNQSIFMKRTTITIISLIIGASFFGLLFLQGRIVDAMVKKYGIDHELADHDASMILQQLRDIHALEE